MAKEVHFGRSGLARMMVGLNKAADTVGGTIGPKGRNVFLDESPTPKITNDGATIADKIVLDDPLENAGAYIIRNVSSQQNDDCGDGTTTVSVLTQAIVNECLARPENPMEIKRSLKDAGDKVLKMLAKRATPIKMEDIEKVAVISSEDRHVAHLITGLIQTLGKDAVINVEDSKTFATETELVDGYLANVGFMSPHFITNKKTGKASYSDVPVLVCEKKISNLQDIAKIFDMFKNEGIGQCVFVCEDIDDSMLGILVQNKVMGTFNSLVIRATGWLLQDIEGATGATRISDSTGITFQNFSIEHLGAAKRVTCDANETMFITDGVSAKEYAKILEGQANSDPNQFAAKKMHERVAKLRGGVGTLKIGASTDFERDYLRLKAEDSVKAVQAALAEGIVEGGGMTLWRIAKELPDNTVGLQILKKAMCAPLQRIVANAGKDYADIVSNLQPEFGYDAKTDRYVRMIHEGIIDPVKVTRCALENAVSAAGTFITTDAIIIEKINETK